MNIDELKMLLALHGNTRLVYMESEIFANKELYKCYLESLCSKYISDVSGHQPPVWAYYYATEVIEGKWAEAEAVIATNRMYANWYNEIFGTNI